ncbi:MAG: helix-turn-helix transcriptional regulator [Umezawaea sp.]
MSSWGRVRRPVAEIEPDFAAAFHEVAGRSPLRQWRLCEAKRLLRETSLALQEIALLVGYESEPALSRAFTRREGLPPGEWCRR